MQKIKSRAELYKLLPPNFISCEVGVAEGLFSRDLLAMGSGYHYMLDAYKTLQQKGDGANNQSWHDKNYINAFKITMPYDSKRTIVKALSVVAATEFADSFFDLVYIDANHAYDAVKADIVAFWRKLKPGGVMAFHDYLNHEYGVGKAVNEWAADNGIKVNLIPENGIYDAGAWLRKPE